MNGMNCIQISFFLMSFWTTFAWAESLPMITQEQLNVGNYWVWTYFTRGDSALPYSAERYEVIEKKDTQILFEIRSRYEEQGEFKAHTRFRVDLARCHHAFKIPNLKTNFLIELYSLSNSKWTKTPIQTPAVAFEEKFNCNPVYFSQPNSLYETRFISKETTQGLERFFQQWPKSPHSQLRSFYYWNHPELKGVAYKKDFNPETPHFYEMRLTSFGNREFR